VSDTPTADGTRGQGTERTLRSVSLSRVALYAVLVGVMAAFLTPIEAGLVTAFKTSPTRVSTANALVTASGPAFSRK
jgi:glucose/mannose transport system permease protein